MLLVSPYHPLSPYYRTSVVRYGTSCQIGPYIQLAHDRAQKFGDVDMSSGKNMFSSLRNSTAAKSAPPAQVAPPTPAAFQRKNDFAPPPRRVPSTGASAPSPAASPAPAPPPALPRRAAQQSGEWAEALYDYHSDDPGDLPLSEGDRVLVVERTSDDWWTGELDGRRGLIPAAYVKVL
ncbi:SH3 domain-containing protein [Earliella scabrosa]|nr:SH3 domain-containing protein [Earliella scabrosa]